MSTSQEERQKPRLLLRPSSRTMNISVSGMFGVSQSTRRTGSVLGSRSRRRTSVLEKSVTHTPRQAVQVFDEDGNNVTPEPLCPAGPAAVQVKAARFFLDEISVGSVSDQTSATGSFSLPFSRSVLGSSRISSQATIESVNEEIEYTLLKGDMPTHFPDVYQKKNTVTEHVTGDMLNEHIHICISETENISLLDIPSTLVSVEADDAETILERNRRYAEVACRNRMGRDNYMDQAVQTLNGAAKNKQTQSDGVVMVDTATTVTNWDLYNTWIRPEQHEAVCSPEPERVDGPAASLKASRGSEMSVSVGSTASTGNSEGRDALLLSSETYWLVASSLTKVEELGISLNAESDLQWIKLSEKFQDCVRLMEKTVLRNTFQPKFAAYRHLPILEDADQQVESGKVDVKEDTKGPHPALECLWAFSCELTRGRSVSSMALNKKNPDLLAVGYGEFDSSNQKPGLVCCWSFKNPMWPDHVIHCDSTVTSLDFSSNNPSQLAVGMLNGVITIYNVQNQNSKSVISSSQCYRKHLGPVWQIRWIQQQLRLTGEEKVEALISAAEDGRISKWFLSNNGLDCTDLMKLRKDIHTKKKTTENKTEERTEIVLSALTPGLSLDFHPTDSSIYLVGTGEGLIHKCSSSNSQQFLETYWKHFCPVTCVSWSPLSPDVFLSCSSDWTIHLWRQDHFCPVLSFTSTHRAVYDIKWSPKWATVFGVISEGQMQIWDLNSSILDPIIVQSAGPGETMTSLLFPSQTDCVLVGDSDGQVTVYQLHNLQRESNQTDVLEGIVGPAASP